MQEAIPPSLIGAFLSAIEQRVRGWMREELNEVLAGHIGPKLMTKYEAAEFLSCSPKTVLKYAREDGLPFRTLGDKEQRYVREELLEWTANRGREGGDDA